MKRERVEPSGQGPVSVRTYSKKAPGSSGGESAPLSPPKQKSSIWSGFFKRSGKSSSSSKAKGKSSKVKSNEVSNEQSFLDLSQKGVSIEVCSLCRMQYSKGIAADESLHAQHCKRFRLGEKWPVDCGETVSVFADGTRLVWVEEAHLASSNSAVRRALEIVDTELGFVECAAPGESGQTRMGCYVLLSSSSSSSSRRVVGMLVITWPVRRAYRILPNGHSGSSDEDDDDGEGKKKQQKEGKKKEKEARDDGGDGDDALLKKHEEDWALLDGVGKQKTSRERLDEDEEGEEEDDEEDDDYFSSATTAALSAPTSVSAMSVESARDTTHRNVVDNNNNDDDDDDEKAVDVGNTVCSGKAESATLGVSRVWVHRDHRRHGYGLRMLQCMLQHQSGRAGKTIQTDDVAFSQPTQNGRLLARRWFNRDDFLVMRE